MDPTPQPVIDWAVATQTMTGHSESGDRAWVKLGAKSARVAVVDGIGHGPEAGRAAEAVVSALEQNADKPPYELLRRCHESSRATRGAVMSFASFDGASNTMTWLGVGNVEGVIFQRGAALARGRKILVQMPGVLGDRLQRISESILKVASGDLLILATDGVRPDFYEEAGLQEPPQEIANRILARCASGSDDALVLVARYGHGQGEKIR